MGPTRKIRKTGKLTGRLYEKAIDGVRAAQPELTREQWMAVERQALNDLAAAGVTSVRSAADSQPAMRAYIALHNRGELILRTSVNILINPNLPAVELEKMLARRSRQFGPRRRYALRVGNQICCRRRFRSRLLAQGLCESPRFPRPARRNSRKPHQCRPAL